MNTKSSRRTFGFPGLPAFRLAAITSALMLAFPAWSFVSGSTGADGPFNPTINTAVQLPPSGVLNYTTINIPAGVTVTFLKNTTNTPVVILATSDVTITGTIDIGGKNSTDAGAAGNGNLGDDGLPGQGGSGGYAGGTGGKASATVPTDRDGGTGQGPGGGGRGVWNIPNGRINGGTGGGYGAVGANNAFGTGTPGIVYGSSALLPLIGGSGGGGGSGGFTFGGSGGAGGGGGMLIASSGTVTIAGSVLATGGTGGASAGSGCGANGGGGSGGAIRVVATTIAGNGSVTAVNGQGGVNSCDGVGTGGAGGTGRIRLEAETFTRTATSNPVHTFSVPGQVFVAGVPTLSITSVAGTNAPASPTGNADITLPASTVNPVTVVFQTTGVPVGNNVKLTVTPVYGAAVTAVSPAITGTTTLGNASVPVSLPSGPSTLLAQTTYTITVAMGQALSMFAQNEQVERIAIKAIPGKANQYFLVTVSGKEFEVPLARLVGVI